MKIILSDNVPNKGKGLLISYKNLNYKIKGWELIDHREIINNNSEKWMNAIYSWHSKIHSNFSKKNRFWMFSQASRLWLWDGPTKFNFKDYFFTLSVIYICKKNKTKDVYILGSSNLVFELLKEFADNSKKQIEIVNESRVLIRLNFPIFIFYVRLLKYLFRGILYCFKRKKSFLRKNYDIAIGTFYLNENIYVNSGDHYFKGAEEDLDSQNSLWIFLDRNFPTKKIRDKINGLKGDSFYFIDNFQLKDVLWSFLYSIRFVHSLNSLKIPQLDMDNHLSTVFPRTFVKKLLVEIPIFFELVLYKQLCTLCDLTNINNLIYPFEDKTIERAMLLAVKNSKNEIKTISFAHCAYTEGFMYLKRKINNNLQSNIIALTGSEARFNFIKSGFNPKYLRIIGSPRNHHQLDTYQKSKGSMNILFITSLTHELVNFVTMLINRPNTFQGHHLIFRKSSHTQIDEQEIALNKLKYKKIPFSIVGGLIEDNIKLADIVIYDITSGSLMASIYGKIILGIHTSDNIKTNHFFGTSKKSKLKFFNNLSDLEKEIRLISSMTAKDFIKYSVAQKKYAEEIYSKFNPTELKKIISS